MHWPIIGIDNSWLQNKVTVEEAEDPNGYYDIFSRDLAPLVRPSSQWDALVARMIEGDELWTFRSPKGTWRHRRGREGIALVRNGLIINAIVTMMN